MQLVKALRRRGRYFNVFVIIDADNNVLGTYHNIASAKYAQDHEFKGLEGLVIRYNSRWLG